MTVSCFLCGAERRNAPDLAGHLEFWHDAPREDARRAAEASVRGENVAANVTQYAGHATWLQLLLPGTPPPEPPRAA